MTEITWTTQRVLARCGELEFALAGVAAAGPTRYPRELRAWLGAKKHGQMHYLARHTAQRLGPARFVPGARSVIGVADRYHDGAADPAGPSGGGPHGRIARYAQGDDYHRVMTKRLRRLAAELAAALPGEVLMSNYGAMKKVALFSSLIAAGVIAATLSSAMASFLGAPRIIQSLAADRIFSFLLFFAKGSGPNANPRRGVLLSAVIAYATVAFGELNLIASVVSMFFLISYGLLNYATFYEA